MQQYDKIYINNDIKDFGDPSQILGLAWKNFPPKCLVLDLGCGQGGDALFLAKNGFEVTAIDSSNVAINQIKTRQDELKFNKTELICGDIREFKIERNKYQVVICRNVLNFLSKDDALKTINDIKDKIETNSFIIIEAFTENDPSFLSDNKFTSYFKEQELLNMFSGYKILYYLENIILDNGHPGFPSPHKHGVARIIAQK